MRPEYEGPEWVEEARTKEAFEDVIRTICERAPLFVTRREIMALLGIKNRITLDRILDSYPDILAAHPMSPGGESKIPRESLCKYLRMVYEGQL